MWDRDCSVGIGRESRTLAAQALLAGIAERGADAVGYAVCVEGTVVVHKQQTGARALLETIDVPPSTHQTLVHVRDYTKGHPTIAANNHPVRHGRVVGIHNGIIANDDELLARHAIERHEPEMTVDSEAIFALVDAHGSRTGSLEEARGAMAAAWVDERDPPSAVARHRPPALARAGRHEAFFASTRDALEVPGAGARDDLPEDAGRGRTAALARGRGARRRAPLEP
jgi:glucosamine 6-phosphate synthetase-like amidotransferase/phosphosugar isomerase protein